LAISTCVTINANSNRKEMLDWLRENISMKYVEECSNQMLSTMTKIMLNGYWAGSILNPFECVNKMKLFRRNALLPIYTSITFDIKLNTVFIYTDGGRLCRPIFYKDDETGKLSFETTSDVLKNMQKGDYSWMELVTGFNKKKDSTFQPNNHRIYSLGELYDSVGSELNPAKFERFLEKKAIIDYIDSSESENAFIAINQEEYPKKQYTHLEIHESFIFGSLCNLINFPENNPPTRNSFSCGQSKQACSMYHTNHQVRMDKTAVVLNNGQIPLVKSRYLDYINREETPYGENAIVAIMCYTGYNVEDAVLINEGALKRGLFHTTYYSTYEAHEESSKHSDTVTDIRFTNIDSDVEVVGTKPGYDYSQLDSSGLIREETKVDEKTVLIGIAASSSENPHKKSDASKTPKKGQLGTVDRTFITEGEEGQRIAKIRIREQRIPNLGDKLASRAGQKGTVGLIIPEIDMPFTKDGIRPDIIINPHAIPSRMTIGQLVESIVGKTCSMLGGFGDCTAFINKGSKIKIFGELLLAQGYHSSGNEILYNGMSGEQLESEIFIGPTYYMRLKHMVKDKINYRALGPRTAMTRQPVSGRANDGGLRIGEMERDSVVSHGIVNFLTESMMERSDKYYMAVCNSTGLTAIYNPSKNLMLSPMADGPVKFVSSIDGLDMRIENVTKYGRSFSVVSVPYSLKLLIQELQTINVQLRIITEDNIQQLENLSYSKNIENVIEHSDPLKLKEIISKLLSGTKSSNAFDVNEKFELFENRFEPQTPDSSQPPYSPQYPDVSPAYYESLELNLKKPTSPVSNQVSPQYPDFSPAYYESPNQGSPQYPDVSPAYYESPESNKNQESDIPNNPQNIQYKEGEVVYFRGDTLNPPSLWKVINVGPNLITIQRETSISGQSDIEIVEKKNLYRRNDIPVSRNLYNNNNNNNTNSSDLIPNQNSNQLGGGSEYQPYNYERNQTPSSMIFAPNIIVSGGDTKTVQGGLPDMMRTNNILPEENNTSTTGGSNDIMNPNVLDNNILSIKKSGGPLVGSDGSDGDLLNLNKIDFSSFKVVKK
jgi:hypothetical protein